MIRFKVQPSPKRKVVWGLIILFGLAFMTELLFNRSSIKHQVRRLIDASAISFSPSVQADPKVPRATTIPHSLAGPLRIHPTNPRYFTDDSGQAIYLTGSHTWLTLQDGVWTDPPPTFDYTAYLNFLQAHNHNFFRLYVWEQAQWSVEGTQTYYFTPQPYQRTGPGTALDGKPKFDLTKLNQAYFDRMRQRVVAAKARGLYVAIMLFNGWSVAYPKGPYQAANPWQGHPFHANNNINGIDGDTNGDDSGIEIHTLSNAAVTAIQEAYVRKVIETVNDLDNVLYEISNESGNSSTEWQYHLIDFIHNVEADMPAQHPVGMTVAWPDGANEALFASAADWISPNDSGNYMADPPAADGRKVVIVDSDHLCGICGDRKWVWKSFTRGLNPIFMDQYDDSYKLDGGGYNINNANDVGLRRNLGYTLAFANRINLAAMTPQNKLASTGYCLAHAAANAAEYLVYLPEGGEVTVDLSATKEKLNVEWFNPQTGVSISAGLTTGGTQQSFTPPFLGDAVLYLVAAPARSVYTPIIRHNRSAKPPNQQ